MAADRPGGSWAWLAGALAAASLLAAALPPDALDWQPGRALAEPWRWWTAAAVHWSPLHLRANLAGAALLAALGLAARLPPSATWAWVLAWPLTQLGLLARPDLAHVGGLSGVLHAGVAIAALGLLQRERGARRAIGAALGLGLLLKVALEAPWGPALTQPAGWDIALAPWVHASGLLAGAVAHVLVEVCHRFMHMPTQAVATPDGVPMDTAVRPERR